MAADGTELTFVRCPHCGSLISAASTQCRWCQKPVSASGKGEEEADKKPASRVRQRTTSVSQNDVMSAIHEPQGDSDDDPLDDFFDDEDDDDLPANGTTEPSSEDPLGAYLEEVEEDSASAPSNDRDEAVARMDEPRAPYEEPEMHVEQGQDAMSEPVTGQPYSAEPYAPERNAPERNASEPSNLPAEPEPQPEPPKPRVIVESGPRRAGSGSALSFAKKATPEPSKPAQDPVPQQEARGFEEFETKEPKRYEEPVQAKEPPPARAAAPQKSAPSVGGAKAHPGRLYGWLVSYTDPNGSAIELREGKFFVTASSLKPTDLVLSDPSVSTPHAMVSVGGATGLQLQDLMSERGVFIRSNEQPQYRREEGIIPVKHGDWIRFGDVEFVVSLIAHVGVK